MAFLQLKKNFHANKSILFRLLQNPKDVVSEENRFGNEEFKIQCSLEGDSPFACAPVNGKSYNIQPKQDFEFVMTSAQYSKIANYDSDDLVLFQYLLQDGRVSYRSNNDESMIKVIMESDAQVMSKPIVGKQGLKYGYESVQHRDNNRSDEIKWGMCINNATKLTISWIEKGIVEEKEDIINSIKDFTNDLMKIAYFDLAEWRKKELEKVVDSINNTDEKESEESSDLPF